MQSERLIQTPALKTALKGRVIVLGDSEYDAARAVFYGGIDSKPAAIVRVADAADVQKTIALAHETGMELAVRSGGHSPAGYCTVENGIVIDCRDLKQIEFDVQARTVWAGAGVTAGELANAADAHDLVIGFGDSGSVGISGITLAGGVGFLVRKFGLTIDNLLAAEVVSADGQILQVDANHHEDLYWAIRGGGGNFGVVTKFKYRLHLLTEVMGGMLIVPGDAQVVADFVKEAERAPEELSAIINVMTAPPMPFLPPEAHGKLIIMALMMYAGDPQEGEKVIAPFRNMAKPIADMLKPMRYREIFFPEDESYHPTAVGRNMFMDHVDTSLAEYMIEQLQSFEAPLKVVQLRVLGGAMSRIPSDATAFAHRQSKIMTNVAAFYTTPEHERQASAWVADVCRMLDQGDPGFYTGFSGKADQGRIREAYPAATLERLTVAKRRYDPANLFHRNLNVQP